MAILQQVQLPILQILQQLQRTQHLPNRKKTAMLRMVPTQDGEDTLTPLGQAKKEAAEYLEALQRERAEFINFRNRSPKGAGTLPSARHHRRADRTAAGT